MKAGRWIFIASVLGFLAGAGVLGLLIAKRAAEGGVAAVDARLVGLAPWFLLGRLGLVALVVGGWPWWTELAARHGRWPPGRLAVVAAWRWRALWWFVVFEAVLVQNGLGRVIRWLMG